MSDEFRRIDLGDSQGDDRTLRIQLEQIAADASSSAPRTSGNYASEMVKIVRDVCIPIKDWAAESLAWIRDRFTDHIVRQAKASKIQAEAEAVPLNTTADVKRVQADAQQKEAEALSTLTQADADAYATRMSANAELLKAMAKLKDAGIDWAAEINPVTGEMDIAFTKRK